MARGVLSHLTNLTQPIEWGKRERKGKGERKERDFRERHSTFSLDFPVIGSANFAEARSKVGPHCKSYAWVPVLGSFDKLQEVGFLLLLWLFLA